MLVLDNFYEPVGVCTYVGHVVAVIHKEHQIRAEVDDQLIGVVGASIGDAVKPLISPNSRSLCLGQGDTH